MEWEWSNDPYMVSFFIYLLLKASHKEMKWKGETVKRGQLIFGRKRASVDTGLSERKIRTCLERLKTTNELTTKTTNKYSIITICNYDSYQDKETQSDQQNDQPNANKRPANDHIQEDKELKEKGFMLFWDYYHKVSGLPKSDKKAAKKYWDKLSLDDARLAYDKVDLYIASVSEKKYIKKARTYLADENFNDEFKVKQRGLVL